jgi:hypothetical protein
MCGMTQCVVEASKYEYSTSETGIVQAETNSPRMDITPHFDADSSVWPL